MKFIFASLTIAGLLAACNHPPSIPTQWNIVRESLESSDKLIADQTEQTFFNMKFSSGDFLAARKLSIWMPPAISTRERSLQLVHYIDSLKTIVNQNNDDNQIFQNPAAIDSLYSKCRNYAKTIAAPYIATRDSARFTMLPIEEALKNTPGDPKAYFSKSSHPMAACLLEKIKNDVLRTEFQLIQYCYSKTRIIKDDRLGVIIYANSSYFKKGQPIEITAGMGEFSLSAAPQFTFDGIPVDPGPDNTAIYTSVANGKPGKHSILVKIEFTMPDGKRDQLTKKVTYNIAE